MANCQIVTISRTNILLVTMTIHVKSKHIKELISNSPYYLRPLRIGSNKKWQFSYVLQTTFTEMNFWNLFSCVMIFCGIPNINRLRSSKNIFFFFALCTETTTSVLVLISELFEFSRQKRLKLKLNITKINFWRENSNTYLA